MARLVISELIFLDMSIITAVDGYQVASWRVWSFPFLTAKAYATGPCLSSLFHGLHGASMKTGIGDRFEYAGNAVSFR